MNCRSRPLSSRHFLLLLSGLLVALSFAFLLLDEEPVISGLLNVTAPLGVALGIALYSTRLLQVDYDVGRVKLIAIFGWVGVITASASVWDLSQHLHTELSTALLLEETITFVSLSTGIGVIFGGYFLHEYRSENELIRDRVLAETPWTNEPGPDPILTTVITQLAELEGVDPLELEPLYEHVDPDVFTEVHQKDDSRWQLLFYTEEYEVRVSSQGMVTIYDTGPAGEGS